MSDKVAYGTLAGAVVVLVVWILQTYWHVELPENVQDALRLLLTALPVVAGAVVAWWKAERHPSPSARETIADEATVPPERA